MNLSEKYLKQEAWNIKYSATNVYTKKHPQNNTVARVAGKLFQSM